MYILSVVAHVYIGTQLQCLYCSIVPVTYQIVPQTNVLQAEQISATRREAQRVSNLMFQLKTHFCISKF